MQKIKFLLCSFLLFSLILVPAISFAQADDDLSGEEFVQTAIDFGITVKFDYTTTNVFEGKPEKLKTVLQAIADEKIQATIDVDGARELSFIFAEFADKGIINPDDQRLTSALSNIYTREGVFDLTPELASLLLDSAYNTAPTTTLEEIAETTQPSLPAEIATPPGEFPTNAEVDAMMDDWARERQIRNWIILIIGLVIVVVGVGIFIKKRSSKSL